MKYFSLAILLLCCITTHVLSQEPVFEKVTVFDSDTYGYASTRDPAICITPKGTILAFCEARFGKARDWDPIDLLMRRSTDGGKTWSDTIVLAGRQPDKPTSNLTPIVLKDGTIVLLYHINYARAYQIISHDDGKSWSPAEDITYVFDQFKPEYNWGVIAPSGPGHAIQLRTGRLLVPVWMAIPNRAIKGGDHRPSCVATIYSDDLGKTWKRGAIVATNSEEYVNPSESHAVELEDGSVLLNMRNETANRRRLESKSPDGSGNWSKPVYNENLYEPVCNAAIERVSFKGKDGKNRIVFCNPDSQFDTATPPRRRVNLKIRMSYDEGQTYPISKVIDPGRSGYSDAVAGKDGMIYVIYEQGERFNSGSVPNTLVVARLNVDWLTDGNDSFKKEKSAHQKNNKSK